MNRSPEVYSAADLAGGGEVFRGLTPPARLAIFGDPVAHSASPPMQNAALKACGKHLQYVRIRVTEAELPAALRDLSPAGFLGTNLTIPHKQAALPLMDELSHEARLMGAINTVAVREGKLHGFNTDGPGFSAAIREQFGTPLKELRVLILGGAGGAGRAVTAQCALERCPSVAVANRNPEKGDALAREIESATGTGVPSLSLSSQELRDAVAAADLIVNATPLGMKEGDPSPLPDGLLESRHLVFDSVYSGGITSLLTQASLAGARGSGGLSMLLHQGALAFGIWFGEPAPLEVMRASLEQARR